MALFGLASCSDSEDEAVGSALPASQATVTRNWVAIHIDGIRTLWSAGRQHPIAA